MSCLYQTNNWNYNLNNITTIYLPRFNKNRWKKKIYKETVQYARNQIQQQMNITPSNLFKIFKIPLEERHLYNQWFMNVEIPKFEESLEQISRKLVNSHTFYKKYLVSCTLKCCVKYELYKKIEDNVLIENIDNNDSK